MGPANDTMAVVDSEGNVHGITGLQVVNASIMPTIPSANTNLANFDVGGTGGCKLEVVRRTFQVKNSDFSECFL